MYGIRLRQNRLCYMLAQHTCKYDIRITGGYGLYRVWSSSVVYRSARPLGNLFPEGE